jgi:hypothetical protein
MTEAPPPVPDWMLERYALGELPTDQSEAIRARLQAEAEAVRAGLTPRGDLSTRLEALQQSDAEILAAHPPRQVAAEIRRRQHLRRAEADHAARSGSGRRWALRVLGPMAAAAIALIVVLPALRDDNGPIRDPDTIEQTTAKGVVSLQVYRDNGRPEGEKLEHGAAARPGDVIQLAYTAGNKRHGVIVSIDGGGAVTLHHPAEPGGSTELSLDGEHKLGFSGELDDAPRYERYFMVTSDKPIDVQRVLDSAARLASTGEAGERDLPLPPNLEQLSVRIDKEAR